MVNGCWSWTESPSIKEREIERENEAAECDFVMKNRKLFAIKIA